LKAVRSLYFSCFAIWACVTVVVLAWSPNSSAKDEPATNGKSANALEFERYVGAKERIRLMQMLEQGKTSDSLEFLYWRLQQDIGTTMGGPIVKGKQACDLVEALGKDFLASPSSSESGRGHSERDKLRAEARAVEQRCASKK
jgi:hypothetical protein